MTATYDAIATTTLTSPTTSYTFTNIPQTYTDLVLSSSCLGSSSSFIEVIQFNSDTSNNYSNTFMGGYVTTSGSNRNINFPYIFANHLNGYFTPGNPMTGFTHIQNYSNSTMYKTVLSRGGGAASDAAIIIGLWRNTSAITSITIRFQSASDLQTGSTFTLYGIKKE